MNVEELEPYIGKHVALVIPLHRRITRAIWGDLTCDIDPASSEKMFNVSMDWEVIRFPINDVHAIEISEKSGVVIRLTS
jgi:hypothetical protein